jgi:recombinational DNA repair protein (RecF pathway)
VREIEEVGTVRSKVKACRDCGRTSDEVEFSPYSGARCRSCYLARERAKYRERKAYADDLMDPIGVRELDRPLTRSQRREAAEASIKEVLRRFGS